MSIEIKESCCVYSKEEWHYKVTINGKEVVVVKWHEQSDYDFDGDIEIIEGEELLTEEEIEQVIDYISEN